MADLGKAYVQIVPSAEGITGSITNVLEPEAESAGKGASKKIATTLSGGLGKAGKMLTAGVTVPLTAIGTASISAFKEVHTGLENIITRTGASGDALEGMERIMKSIASSVPADFNVIGDAIGEVNTRFGVTGSQLETLSSQFVKFADINNTDVASSVDVVQKAMAAFGMETTQTGDMLDILNKVGQNTGASVLSLAQSMVSNSAALHEMGFNASQSAQFLGELEVAGIDSTQMMTGLKKALQNAAKEGKPLDQALSDVQNSIMGASSSTEAMAVASELFGARAGPAIAEACRNGIINFNDLGAAVEGYGGSVENTFQQTQTPLDQFKTNMNALKSVGSDIGEILLSKLNPVLERLTELLTNLVEKWNTLSPATQNFLVTIGLIAAAIGPLLMVIGAIVPMFSLMGAGLSVVAGAFAFLVSPIGLVVAAIAGLIAIGVYLYTHWQELGPIFKGIWEGIKETASTIWNAIKMAIISPVLAVINFVKTNWTAIKTWLSTTWNSVKTSALAIWTAIKTAIATAITAAKTTVTTIVNGIKSTVTSVFNSIKSTATSVWNNIKTAMTKPIEAAKSTIKGILDKIKSFFPIKVGNLLSGIKLPHFNWTWETVVGGIKLPKFTGISWYRKAYETPYLFNTSTIVPTSSGLKGFGDGNGGEIVYGRNQLMRDIAEASGGGTYTFNIYGAAGQSPREIAEEVQKIMSREMIQRRAAWA